MIVDGERVKLALGIKGATKYGPTRDFSTRMAYEIVDAIDDAVISEEEPEIIMCKDCKYYCELLSNYCPNCGAETEIKCYVL